MRINNNNNSQEQSSQNNKITKQKTLSCENISYMFNVLLRDTYYKERKQNVIKYYDSIIEPSNENKKNTKNKPEVFLECKNKFTHINRTKAFNKIFDTVLSDDFTTERFAICLGEENVTENSISIHPTYGVAYIPSSSIKGFFKAYLKNFIIEADEDLLNKLFGTEEQRGILVFDDAFPVNDYIIELFRSAFTNKTYFREFGNEMLFNEDIDVLIYPTVVNSTFKFSIYKFKDKNIDDSVLSKLQKIYEKQFSCIQDSCKITNTKDFNELINSLFTEALFFQGIGAKTSVGFGSFTKAIVK